MLASTILLSKNIGIAHLKAFFPAFLLILATSFGIVFIIKRSGWALVIAYSFAMLAGISYLLFGPFARLAAPAGLLAISIVYFFLYFKRGPNFQWAILPGGLLATLSLLAAAFVLNLIPLNQVGYRLASSLFLTGIALTFCLVWLRTNRSWPGFIVFLLACAIFMNQFILSFERAWPMILLSIGIGWFIHNLTKPITP